MAVPPWRPSPLNTDFELALSRFGWCGEALRKYRWNFLSENEFRQNQIHPCNSKKLLYYFMLRKICFKCLTIFRNCERKTRKFSHVYLNVLKAISLLSSFRGISSRLGSAFIFLRWFKLAYISIQVTSLHTGEEFELISKLLKASH